MGVRDASQFPQLAMRFCRLARDGCQEIREPVRGGKLRRGVRKERRICLIWSSAVAPGQDRACRAASISVMASVVGPSQAEPSTARAVPVGLMTVTTSHRQGGACKPPLGGGCHGPATRLQGDPPVALAPLSLSLASPLWKGPAQFTAPAEAMI